MTRIYQIPSHARGWLTLSVIAVSLPQLWIGPLWQTGLLSLVLLWRALIERQRLAQPSRWVRLLILLVTVLATFHSFGRLHGPAAGSALITSLLALKYLELISKRDAYVVVMLGYFVCATILLFHRGPAMALYVFACLVLLTASLAGINYSDTHGRRWQHLSVAAVMVGQALPLAVALFVLVPRIAPLWNMQLDGGQARTGMSDSLSPGQVSQLTESSELVFRVQFEGPPPPLRERYWRGLTYSYFDGTTWRQASPSDWQRKQLFYDGRGLAPQWYKTLKRAAESTASDYRYQVIMEASQQRWLYALAVPFSAFQGQALARDFRLVADNPISGTYSYPVRSVDVTQAALPLTATERRLLLQLPEQGNSRARALAQRWRHRYSKDEKLVEAALRHFREQPFYYTLEPPRLAGDSVGQFLFGTQRGFCEHYASSFAFLMRAAGIPARVVGGYQGGEMNNGDYLQVRQYDAHAWVDVWLPEQGWVQVDPTAAVAPERIEQGLRGTFQDAVDSNAPQFQGLRRLPVLFQIQQWVDYIDFNWQKWVLGYRQETQRGVLEKLLGAVTPLRIGIALMTVVTAFALALGVIVLHHRHSAPLSPLEREFARLHQGLRQRGLTVPARLSAAQLEAAVVERWPMAAGAMEDWRRQFEHLAYRDQGEPAAADLTRLRRLRQAVLRSLKWSKRVS